MKIENQDIDMFLHHRDNLWLLLNIPDERMILQLFGKTCNKRKIDQMVGWELGDCIANHSGLANNSL